MGLKEKAMEKIAKNGFDEIAKLNKSMQVLEQHMVVVAENQVEFEKYLKEIRDLLKKDDN